MLHAIAGSMDNTVVVWRWPEGTAQYVVSRASSSLNSVSLEFEFCAAVTNVGNVRSR